MGTWCHGKRCRMPSEVLRRVAKQMFAKSPASRGDNGARFGTFGLSEEAFFVLHWVVHTEGTEVVLKNERERDLEREEREREHT